MTDQELADRVFDAVREVNDACEAAVDAGLDANVSSFTGFPPYTVFVRRYIPAVITELVPSKSTTEAA